jgi:predicted dehydrogenase
VAATLSEVNARTFQLGFAGVGWLGESLIKELPRFSQLRLAAVQDTNLELARQVAQRYTCRLYTADYAELMNLAKLDAVVICTPNTFHAPQAQAAVRAGKHVLVQKPLALSPKDARATLDLAGSHQRVLFVDYTYRYLPTIQAFYACLEGLGKLRAVRAVFHNIYGPGKAWFFDPALSGGGALMDLGVHLIDLGVWLLQPRHARLEHVELSFTQGYAVEDAATVQFRFDTVPFEMQVSWKAPRPLTEIAFEVEAEGGRLRWENVDGSFFHFRTWRDDTLLLDRETTLREDTLREFLKALQTRQEPINDERVYRLLRGAYRFRLTSARPSTTPAHSTNTPRRPEPT